MSREIILILLGALIALTSSIATALVQHFLTLRADKLKRKWDADQKELETLRNSILQSDPALAPIREKILKGRSGMLPSLEQINNVTDERILVFGLRQLAIDLNWNEHKIEGVVGAVEQYFAT